MTIVSGTEWLTRCGVEYVKNLTMPKDNDTHQPEFSHSQKREIKSLGDFGGPYCPRCGWGKGQRYPCGLCEGHIENIINWFVRLLIDHANKKN